MIKNINLDFQLQNIQNKKNVKPADCSLKTTTNPIDNFTMEGLKYLGIYNMALVKNKENFSHKPGELIIPVGTSMEKINGDKIFDPYGKLEYIVQNDGEYETRYYPHSEKPDFVSHVEIKRVYDGKLLKQQESSINSTWANITEYSKEQPNVSYATRYYDGKVDSIEKIEKMPNGLTKHYEKNFYNVNPQLNIRLKDEKNKNSIDVSFDSNNTVKNIHLFKAMGENNYYKDITLNKGAVIGINESKDTVIPNYMEQDVLNDQDILPADKFDREKLEANAKNSQKDIYSFYGNGCLKEVNDKNIKIEFNEDGSQIIKEYLNNGITKTTSYNEDGSISVNYRNGKEEKFMEFSSDNKPVYYSINRDGKCVRSASFSEEGYLCYSD